ncbi:uncharacterized protein LOC115799196 [Archocentrus centrarchus]|uniref:uncharacterized protein LOC115799196 n=1 Tax=Archocentrus centrarchus TaxID=63155 RepID=UPI0011EA2E66|nr:uncharacterized protein LOC115799196 [Archocentrus centrarchus]
MMSVVAALCVNMLTASLLLRIFILSSALAACPEDSALFIIAPQQMEALSGSCLQIPCNFRDKPENTFNGRRPFGVWIKNEFRFLNPKNVIFNSSGAVSTYPMSITGNLSQKDCTTLFSNLTTTHTDTYFFRVESESFKATAYCDHLQITVRDSPWRPSITVSGDLKEKESVTITCSAFTPCPHSPPELTWTLQQDSHSKIEQNRDGSFTTKIQQIITLSDTHDGQKISCSATYPVNQGEDTKTAETAETLSVSYPPRDTSLLISPTDPVSVGSTVSLTCLCRANPPADSYVWFMTHGEKLEMIKADTQVYSFEVTKLDRGRLYFCGCRNPLDTQLSTGSQLLFEGDEHLGKSVGVYAVIKTVGIIMLVSTLVIFECWFRSRCLSKPEGHHVTVTAVLQPHKLTLIHFLNHFLLNKRPDCTGRCDSAKTKSFLCKIVTLAHLETGFCAHTLAVGMFLTVLLVSGALADCPRQPNLFITAPKTMEALSGSCLQIPCSFTLKEEQEFISTSKIFGVWIKNDSRFNYKPNNVIFNSSGAVSTYPMSITGNLSERKCTTLFSNLTTTHTDTYFFRVEKEPFKATASCDPLQITVRDSPQKPSITVSGDLKEKESVTITCSAFTPCPHSPPELTWTLQQDSHSKIEENRDGSFTAEIQQTITLSDTHDGQKISCSARYPVSQGEDTKTAVRDMTLNVSYTPKQTSASIHPSGLVSAGSWVNLTCSSRAKPPVSSFTWFKNSTDGPVSVSEGQIYSFNVTDGGVYYCVATNDLGNQTSAEIDLNIAGSEQPSPLWPAVGGIIGLIIFICMILILWWLKSSKQGASHQTQNVSVQEAARTAENEGIHYGEIVFSKQRPGPSLNSVQGGTQQQDLVYSQVKVGKTANSLTQTECIYSQVQKK